MTGRPDNVEDKLPEQQRELLKQLLLEKAKKPRRAIASSGQRRLWFINRLEEPNPSYNVSYYVRLKGKLDTQILERSLNSVIQRHGILRTTFEESDGEPVQVVNPSLKLTLPVFDLEQTNSSVSQVSLEQVINDESMKLFDLSKGPLIRAKLIRISELEHVLVLVTHHIISDGWSVGVLNSELFSLYEALSNGKESPLSPLPIQYLDYSARQLNWLKGEECQQQLDYWTKQLANLPVMELPTDHARPQVKGYQGTTLEFELDLALAQKLNQLCRDEGVTLYMLLMTCFSILLYRYSNQEDVVFGSPIASRSDVDSESLIGYFVNVLVMRSDLSGDPSFRDLLSQISATALDAYSNHDIPFDKLVEEIQPDRNPGYSPLFQVVFALQKKLIDPDPVNGLKIDRPVVLGYDAGDLDINVTVTRHDLELHLWEDDNGMRGTWAFDISLFESATIERMTKSFISLLDDVVTKPDRRISELAILSAADRHQILLEWNQTTADYASDKAIHELFEAHAEQNENALALVFEGDELTYGQLNQRANQLANYLIANGIERESLVGVCLERGIELITSVLAIFKAGAAYVPLDPKYPESRLDYMINDSAVSIVLSHSKLERLVSGYQGNVISIDEDADKIAQESNANLSLQITSDSLAYVIYTSGSTGKPKGTLLEHRGLCKVSAEQQRHFDAGPGSRVLQFSSPNFDAALFDFTMSLTTGGALILAKQEDLQPGPPLSKLLREQRITILTIPPSSLSVLSPEILPDLKVINVAGEPCSAQLVEQWAPGRRFFNLYGPTEATIWSTANECTADGTAPHIGKPINNTRIYVLDHNARPVPVGVPGELCIGGDGLARGYLNLPELTAERFIPDPFNDKGYLYRSGDKVRFLPDGSIEFVGRIDHQVKIRGLRIEPGEIETQLRAVPGVGEAIVIADKGSDGDLQLLAFVSTVDGAQLTVETLRDHVREVLPSYMMPAQMQVLDALPLNPNGKVDRNVLLALKSEAQKAQTILQSPQSQMEQTVNEVWQQVLNLDAIDVNQNFFDLGGHSLMLAKVQTALNEKVEYQISLVDLFQYTTISALAQFLEQQSKPKTAEKPRDSQADKDRGQHRQRMAKLAQLQRSSRQREK